MKKKIALALTMSTLMTSGVASAFSDVTPDRWYHREIMALKEKGIVNGYEDGTFRAEKEVLKAETLAMVLRSAGIEAEQVNGQTHWADGLVLAGAKSGVIRVSGFERDAPATRVEVAEMIVRSLGLENEVTDGTVFADSTSKYGNILYKKGILKGEEVGGRLYLRPDRTITRAEMGALTLRVIEHRSAETGQTVEKEVHPKLSQLVTESEVKIPKEPKTVDELEKVFIYMGYKNLNTYSVKYSTNDPKGFLTTELRDAIAGSFERTFTRYPEYYSFTNRLGYKMRWANGVAELTFERKSEHFSTDELREKQDKYRESVRNEVIGFVESGLIKDTMTEKEKARVVYDWVLGNTEYDYGYQSASFTGYGQYFNDIAVCQGYVATYNMMLKFLGIDVQGVSGQAGRTAKEEHIWSRLILDGETFYSDPTWGDTGNKDADKYFNTTREILEKTHIWGLE